MNLKTSSFEDLSRDTPAESALRIPPIIERDLSRDTPAESALRIPPIIERGSPGSGQPYFDWRVLFPELQLLLDNFDDILEEAKTIQKWIPWPEDHFAKNGVTNWTVFPFLHTFPAYDVSRQMWIPSTCEHCPKTTALLRQIPNIRTALFSRLGSGVKISPHTGWADLANYVLRCHIPIFIPPNHLSGLWVDTVEQFHMIGEINVFDDSKIHKAFNLPMDSASKESSENKQAKTNSEEPPMDRIVLIVDILRPSHLPLGGATGNHTQELDTLISLFT